MHMIRNRTTDTASDRNSKSLWWILWNECNLPSLAVLFSDLLIIIMYKFMIWKEPFLKVLSRNSQQNIICVTEQDVVPLGFSLTLLSSHCLSRMCTRKKKYILLCVSQSYPLSSHHRRVCNMTAWYPLGRFSTFCWKCSGLSVLMFQALMLLRVSSSNLFSLHPKS